METETLNPQPLLLSNEEIEKVTLPQPKQDQETQTLTPQPKNEVVTMKICIENTETDEYKFISTTVFGILNAIEIGQCVSAIHTALPSAKITMTMYDHYLPTSWLVPIAFASLEKLENIILPNIQHDYMKKKRVSLEETANNNNKKSKSDDDDKADSEWEKEQKKKNLVHFNDFLNRTRPHPNPNRFSGDVPRDHMMMPGRDFPYGSYEHFKYGPHFSFGNMMPMPSPMFQNPFNPYNGGNPTPPSGNLFN